MVEEVVEKVVEEHVLRNTRLYESPSASSGKRKIDILPEVLSFVEVVKGKY